MFGRVHEERGGARDLSGGVVTNLGEVSVPFVTSQGADFQNRVF